MKSIHRSLGAALLALPAALLLAQPAAAQDHRWGRHDGYRYQRDHRPPVIVDVSPERRVGDRGRTRIAARFHDQGSGVAAVRLRVDGRDVTRAARFGPDEVRYRENLAPGRHFAEVIVRDRAGNVSRRAWSFVVVDRDRGNRYRPFDYHGYYGQAPYQRW